MSRVFDAIVIGVGSMGSATCRALAQRGASVLGLEARSIPHAEGAHHGLSRLFRLAYYEHPDYVPLLRRARDLWLQLNERANSPVFHQTGAVFAGPPDGELVPGSRDSAARHALTVRDLGPADLRQEFPHFRLPESFVGLWEPTAGYIHPELAIAQMAAEAADLGADVRGHEPVLEWSASGAGVRVVTARGEHHAARLIIAAGAWSSRVLGSLHVPLTVTRQVVLWTMPQHRAQFARGRFPCWAVEVPDGHAYYGFPIDPTSPGLKSARHWRATPTDPDRVDRRLSSADEQEVRGFLRAHLPDADGPLSGSAVCLYTNTPDAHFILDRHPAHDNVAIAAGFSGHGFKFAPVIGEVMADLCLDGRSRLGIGRFALARFTAP